jgi:hypothetical protein
MPAAIKGDDIMAFPVSQIATPEDFTQLRVSEGTDVFFVGMFVPHIGEKRIYPVVRFGHVALLSEEKVVWNGVPTDLYLIESSSYGGNSGSPVFLWFGMGRADGSTTIDMPNVRLAGVMKGTFLDAEPLREAATNRTPFSVASNGVAAVAPAYHLREILFSPELVALRKGPVK